MVGFLPQDPSSADQTPLGTPSPNLSSDPSSEVAAGAAALLCALADGDPESQSLVRRAGGVRRLVRLLAAAPATAAASAATAPAAAAAAAAGVAAERAAWALVELVAGQAAAQDEVGSNLCQVLRSPYPMLSIFGFCACTLVHVREFL